MNPYFLLAASDIQILNDEQSRELIARLCRAEVKQSGGSEAFVSWGGDQRAKDGGVDVYIDCERKISISGYVKSQESAFQVKAEKFNKAKIIKEMAPKGILRPAIGGLASEGGAYIIVSTRDDCSQTSLTSRTKAMRDCLSDHGIGEEVEVDFYDCRKIADWVEQYPSIVAWVRQIIGKPLSGWRPYTSWSYSESDSEAEYILDEKARVFASNNDRGLNTKDAIGELREALSESKSVRIVGLSGVGKTRLVQALFDERIKTDEFNLNKSSVLYCDISDSPDPNPVLMAASLVESSYKGVLVIDNCGPDLHKKINELLRKSESQIGLITVEYDIKDDLPEETDCYHLLGSSGDVIEKLLAKRFGFLSKIDIEKISEFSDGNARIAFALAGTTNSTGELGRLRDVDLFKRLFFQKDAEDESLIRCAEAASLVYSFDGEDVSQASELGILSRIAGSSILEFSRNISKLMSRGLVQSRAKWRAVLPHAIANRLADQAVEFLPKDLLMEAIFSPQGQRLIVSFSRRMGFLHGSKRVVEIAEEWLSSGGFIGSLEHLSELERKVFENISPVSVEATLEAIERAASYKGFISVRSIERGVFSRVTRHVAYESHLFKRAAKVLVTFALEEPEGYNNNSVRKLLASLFFIHLSGTEAGPKERGEFIEELILSGDEDKKRLALSLLESALQTSHFSSSYGFDFGARKRGFGWRPRSPDQIREWYVTFLNIALEIGSAGDQVGQDAKAILAQSIRGLCAVGLIDEVERVSKEMIVEGEWVEGWLGVKRAIRLDKMRLNEADLKRIYILERDLSPKSLKAVVGAKVLSKGTFSNDFDFEDEDPASAYERAEEEAEELGRLVGGEKGLIDELLPQLLRGNSGSKVWPFGFGFSQKFSDIPTVLDSARKIVSESAPSALSLIFIRGLLSGWSRVDGASLSRFLDSAVVDEVWAPWFAEIQIYAGADARKFERLMRSLVKGRVPARQYGYLGMGRVTDAFSVEEIFELLIGISRLPEGLSSALDILSMVVHLAAEKDDEYKSALAKACLHFMAGIDWFILNSGGDRLDYDIGQILDFSFSKSSDGQTVSKILSNILDNEAQPSRYLAVNWGRALTPFLKYFPELALDELYSIGDVGHWRACQMLEVLGSDEDETAISCVPLDVLINWCNLSPEGRFEFAARTCSFLKHVSDGESDVMGIDPVAISVLAGAIDKCKVVQIFIERIYPSSWSGYLSEILKRRLPVLDMFNPSGDDSLKEIISKAKSELIKRIELEAKREGERERESSERFE